MAFVHSVLREIYIKAPPGPPPRPGLEWKEETHRWIRPYEHDSIPMYSIFSDELIAAMSDDYAVTRYYTLESLYPKIEGYVNNTFIPEEASSYMKATESRAIMEYTGASGFTGMNMALRAGDPLELRFQERVEGLQKVMGALGQAQTLYRGINKPLLNSDGSVVQGGDKIEIDSFMSTSRMPRVPFKFMGWPGAAHMVTYLEIAASANAYGITLSNDDTVVAEDETILEFGQTLYIEFAQEIRPGVMYVKGRIG